MTKREKKELLNTYKEEFKSTIETHNIYSVDDNEAAFQRGVTVGAEKLIQALGFVIVRRGDELILRKDSGMYEEQCRVKIW